MFQAHLLPAAGINAQFVKRRHKQRHRCRHGVKKLCMPRVYLRCGEEAVHAARVLFVFGGAEDSKRAAVASSCQLHRLVAEVLTAV